MAISANHTKFTYPDYISPLPADDLIKVALYKQDLYDQGVAKVQSQIDSYSQLRSLIPTEVEQQYFDETMTKLVQAVNSSAGLDFSKKANVQSVLNIGKPLEKDKNIINAVQNGRQIQKRYQTLADLDKSKRSPTNDWAYLHDIEEYKKANRLGISLQDKEYDEYFDISEMVTEFVKELSPLEQQEFIGKTDGTPQGYLEVLTQQGFGKTQLANRIKGMLNSNPKAARQLQIDTEYYYNRMGPERAYQAYVEDQTEKAAAITDQVQKTEQQLATLRENNARVKSPIIQQEIKKVENELKLLKQYEGVALQNSAKRFEEFNPRDYFETYQNQFVTNLANTYSVQKVSRDLKDDKVWDVLQKRQIEYLKFDLDVKKDTATKQKERIDTYNRTTKQSVIDIPAAKSVIQAVSKDKARRNLQIIENIAKEDGNVGSANRISKFIKLVEDAYQTKGTDQLNKLAAALSYLKESNALNNKYKKGVAEALGFEINPNDENSYVALMNRAYSQIKALASKKEGIDLRTPISFNNGFDYTLGSFDNINFMLNSNELGDQFAIALPPQTVTQDPNVQEPTVTTKFGLEPAKPINQ